jgi:hypothetical protein
MTKKLLVLLALIALVSGGAFAQLTFGITGALHMDTKLSASEISNDFKTGDNIYYGGFIEIIGQHLGLGLGINMSPATTAGAPIDLINYDADLYLSYHFFGGRAFLDPFGEVGLGVFALDYKSSSDRPTDPITLAPIGTTPIAASPYWYGALGLGVNLGPIGFFGKFAVNMIIQRQLKDKDGTEIPYFGTYALNGTTYTVTEYVPRYRFTLGVKLIL